MTAMLLIGGSVSVAAAAQSEQSGFASQSCPADFFGLPLYPDAKMCQLFSDGLPASLTYHASTDQSTAQKFFTQNLGNANKTSTLLGRTVLEYDGSNVIIVISKDGDGSQVDVLVKSDIQSPFAVPSSTVEAETADEESEVAEFFEPEREVLAQQETVVEESGESALAEESPSTEAVELAETPEVETLDEMAEQEPEQALESEPESMMQSVADEVAEGSEASSEVEPMVEPSEQEIAEVEKVEEEVLDTAESTLQAEEPELVSDVNQEAVTVEQSITEVAATETSDLTMQQTIPKKDAEDEPPMDGDYPVEDF